MTYKTTTLFWGIFIVFYGSMYQAQAQAPQLGENRLMYILWLEGSIWNETQKQPLEVGSKVHSDDLLTCKSGACKFIASDSSVIKHYRVSQKTFYKGVTEILYKILTPFLFQHRSNENPEANIPRLGPRGVYFEDDEQEAELIAYKSLDSTLFVLDKCLLRIDQAGFCDYYINQEKLNMTTEGYLIIDKALLKKTISTSESASSVPIRCISREDQKTLHTSYLPVYLVNESRLKTFFKTIRKSSHELGFSKENYKQELFLAFWFNYGATDFNQLNSWLLTHGL